MKKYFLTLTCTCAIFFCAASSVSAHVLLRDPKANIGAVVHINPDDDPIAGQVSQLYFDLQDKNSEVRIAYSGYELVVTNEAGVPTIVPLSVFGSTLGADYTFPTTGLYTLTLRSKASYDQFQKVSMQDSVRISRGVEGTTQATSKNPYAFAVAFGSAIAFMVLGIVAFNNRQEIARHSTF